MDRRSARRRWSSANDKDIPVDKLNEIHMAGGVMYKERERRKLEEEERRKDRKRTAIINRGVEQMVQINPGITETEARERLLAAAQRMIEAPGHETVQKQGAGETISLGITAASTTRNAATESVEVPRDTTAEVHTRSVAANATEAVDSEERADAPQTQYIGDRDSDGQSRENPPRTGHAHAGNIRNRLGYHPAGQRHRSQHGRNQEQR